MSTAQVRHIISEIGPEALQDALNVGARTVRAAATSGAFPASWFDVVDRMCAARGLDCPRELFNFKPCGVARGDPAAGQKSAAA